MLYIFAWQGISLPCPAQWPQTTEKLNDSSQAQDKYPQHQSGIPDNIMHQSKSKAGPILRN